MAILMWPFNNISATMLASLRRMLDSCVRNRTPGRVDPEVPTSLYNQGGKLPIGKTVGTSSSCFHETKFNDLQKSAGVFIPFLIRSVLHRHQCHHLHRGATPS